MSQFGELWAEEVEELFEKEHLVSVGLLVNPSLSEGLNLEEQNSLPTHFLILISGKEVGEEGGGPVYE